MINAVDNYGKVFCKQYDWLILNHNDSAIVISGFILRNNLSGNDEVIKGMQSDRGSYSYYKYGGD